MASCSGKQQNDSHSLAGNKEEVTWHKEGTYPKLVGCINCRNMV